MFREIILPIFRSTRLCVTACGIMHPRCRRPLLLHLVGCLYYLYQWCTVKQISDKEIYLLIKYTKSVLWRVAKCLSYIQDARCLKVKCSTLCAKSVNSNFWCRIVNRVAVLKAFTVLSNKPTFISPKLASLPICSVCHFLSPFWLVVSQLGILHQYDKWADGIRLQPINKLRTCAVTATRCV